MTFAAAAPVQRSFTVSKAPQTITFAPLADATLNIGSVFVFATSSTGGPVTFSTSTASVCTTSGTGGEVDLIAAGTCTVRTDQGGTALDAAAPTVTRSFAVTKASQAITFAGGTCIVRASQAGNGTYAPAAAVTRQFTVGSPVGTASQPGYWMLGADGRV